MNQLINSNGSVFLDYEMSVRIQNIYYNLLIQALQKHCKVFVLRMDYCSSNDVTCRVRSSATVISATKRNRPAWYILKTG